MRIIYKYMGNPNFLLESGYIRATQLSALNDPFEASYCKDSLKELSSYFELCSTGDELIEYIEENKHRVGVISFTEAKDNLLMWSHYANEHKGSVVGFYLSSWAKLPILPDLFELQISKTSWSERFELFKGECLPVSYRKQPRYRVDKFDFDYSNICAEGPDRILFEIFQQKSDEWIYEKEHRITLRLEQSDLVKVRDIEKIKNKHVLNRIINSDNCSREESEDGTVTHIIHLNKIENSSERESSATALATLSKNPLNIYLFKLGSIKSVFMGKNSTYESLNLTHVNSNVEVWETTLNHDFYTLNFSELT